MLALVVVSFLALTASAFPRPIGIGGDARTWSPKVNETETETVDKCVACKTIVNFIENQQKICTVVPKNMEATCEQIIHEYPPDVICKNLCMKTKTYEIHL